MKLVESKKIIFLFMGGKSGQALPRYSKLPQAVENMFWFLPRKIIEANCGCLLLSIRGKAEIFLTYGISVNRMLRN